MFMMVNLSICERSAPRQKKQAIYRALEHTNNNISKASRLLGISRPTLYNLFAKHEITVDEPDE